MVVACQSQVAVLNKLLATKQRNVTPPPTASPAVRTRTLSSSFDSVSQSGLHLSQFQSNSNSQLNCSDGSSLLDEANSSTVSDSKSNEDTVSLTSQKSSSSCVISWSYRITRWEKIFEFSVSFLLAQPSIFMWIVYVCIIKLN